MTDYKWTGTTVNGATSCAIVKYYGPTNARPSRWIATLTRAKGETYRATVSFSGGPMEAARLAAGKAGCPHWCVGSVHTIDADTYCIGFKAT